MDERAQEDKAQAPTITVCIIAYNSGPTLRTCLERLAAQTFADFETLVIDNASPDPGDGKGWRGGGQGPGSSSHATTLRQPG